MPVGKSIMTGQMRRLSLGELFWLSLYWFATSFHWGALLAVVIPAEVIRFVPEAQKGSYLGLLFAAGAAIAMVVTPVAGALSDRSILPMGAPGEPNRRSDESVCRGPSAFLPRSLATGKSR